MSKTKYRFTYDEVRVIVLALVELKNQLIQEGRYTDPRESAQDDELVSIKVDLDGIELNQGRYVPPEKPTYKNIKQWILDKYGFKVSTLYIAQIKDKVGLEKRKNYNPGSGEGKVPICPPEKEEAIMDAFRHYNLI